MPTAKVIIPADLRQIIRPSAENISFGNSGSPKAIVLIPCSTLGHNRPRVRQYGNPSAEPATILQTASTTAYRTEYKRRSICREHFGRAGAGRVISAARTRRASYLADRAPGHAFVRPETSTRTTVPVPLTITGKRMSPAEGGASKGFSGASTIIGTRSFSSVGCISS